LDPDTMMPISKAQKGLYAVGEEKDEDEEEEDEELDPDTMMPIKKTKGPKPPAMRQFVSYRARKLTGWTPPTGGKLISVDDEQDISDDDDKASLASARTNLSAFEIPRNELHSIDLQRRTDRVMTAKTNAYQHVLSNRGGLDSFEGRIRARRSEQNTAAAGEGGRHGVGGGVEGKEKRVGDGAIGMDEALEETWDGAVEGVSRVFRFVVCVSVCVFVCERNREARQRVWA